MGEQDTLSRTVSFTLSTAIFPMYSIPCPYTRHSKELIYVYTLELIYAYGVKQRALTVDIIKKRKP